MSNTGNQLNPATRTMLASAIIGGSVSVARQWESYQKGDIDVSQLSSAAVKASLSAGLAGGAATAVASQIAGRSALSLASLLLAGTAGLYLIDDIKGNNNV